MPSELCIEVGKRVEGVGVIETALILAVAAFDLAVVTRRVGTNQLVPDPRSAAVFSKSVTQSLFDCAKRLVDSKPLSV